MASGSHLVTMKGASLRRKAEQSVARTWDLGDITERLILRFQQPVLPLDFQLCEIMHFLIFKANLSHGFLLLVVKRILTGNTREMVTL